MPKWVYRLRNLGLPGQYFFSTCYTGTKYSNAKAKPKSVTQPLTTLGKKCVWCYMDFLVMLPFSHLSPQLMLSRINADLSFWFCFCITTLLRPFDFVNPLKKWNWLCSKVPHRNCFVKFEEALSFDKSISTI
jgi:hypothetical protein